MVLIDTVAENYTGSRSFHHCVCSISKLSSHVASFCALFMQTPGFVTRERSSVETKSTLMIQFCVYFEISANYIALHTDC